MTSERDRRVYEKIEKIPKFSVETSIPENDSSLITTAPPAPPAPIAPLTTHMAKTVTAENINQIEPEVL